MKRSRNPSSPESSGARSLSAAFLASPMSSARYTTLIPPRPSRRSTRYPAISDPIRESALTASSDRRETGLSEVPSSRKRERLLAGAGGPSLERDGIAPTDRPTTQHRGVHAHV